MYDPNQLTDANGLSADSLRGSEHFVLHRDVNNDSRVSPRDNTLNLSREPLSYHEAAALDRTNVEYKDDVLHDDVRGYRDSLNLIPNERYGTNMKDQEYTPTADTRESFDARRSNPTLTPPNSQHVGVSGPSPENTVDGGVSPNLENQTEPPVAPYGTYTGPTTHTPTEHAPNGN